MPITITFHLFGLVFSLRIKWENRHSAKWRFSGTNPIIRFNWRVKTALLWYPCFLLYPICGDCQVHASIDNVSTVWYNCFRKGILHSGAVSILSLRKEVIALRITFHVGNFTVTIIIKERKNRHSAQWRFFFLEKFNWFRVKPLCLIPLLLLYPF